MGVVQSCISGVAAIATAFRGTVAVRATCPASTTTAVSAAAAAAAARSRARAAARRRSRAPDLWQPCELLVATTINAASTNAAAKHASTIAAGTAIPAAAHLLLVDRICGQRAQRAAECGGLRRRRTDRCAAAHHSCRVSLAGNIFRWPDQISFSRAGLPRLHIGTIATTFSASFSSAITSSVTSTIAAVSATT